MASLHRHCLDPIWIVDDCFLRIFTACKKSPLELLLQCKRALFVFGVSKITWETEALHIYLWCFSFFLYSSWGFLMNDI